MGFSCQKPTRQSKEQDLYAIVEWRDKQWSRIKQVRKAVS
ncbi:hypothetical protein AB1K70_17710 [Bremerella sp. JC770]